MNTCYATKICCLAPFLALAALAPVLAQDDVRVIKNNAAKTSLDLSGFTGPSGGASTLFRRTLEADLQRSGWFTFSRPGAYSVFGSYGESGAGLSAKCQVFGAARSTPLLNKTYGAAGTDARRTAHKVADDIIMAVKGFRGIASGRIVAIGTRTGSKEVYMLDSDGGGIRQLTADRSISLSPAWSPDGSRIAYTSFRRGYPDIYVIDLRSNNRACIANYPGINMAGAFSPAGGELLMVLSKDGNPEVYVKDLGGGRLTRLTNTPRAGEASPTWSPDGSQVAYVSDLSGTGSPQIYVMGRSGGSRRLTSRGRENVSPDWGPNGWIVYASRRSGAYSVCMINPQSGEDREIAGGDASYEDPCWASDGRHVVCTRQEGRTKRLYMLDTMGDPALCLTPDGGGWSSPAWCAQ